MAAYPFSTAHSLQSHRPCPRGRHSICHPQSTCPCQPMLETFLRMHPQFSIHIKSLICLDLHLPDPFTWRYTILDRRLELVAPWTPPAIAIAVVVAAQKVALRLGALLGGERNINRFEEIFFELRVQADDMVDVLLDILGVEAPEEVAGPLLAGLFCGELEEMQLTGRCL